MYAVQQALLDGNIQPCLAWCDRHHRKLRKLESRIELVARQQEAVTLIELGNIPEAVAYVKKYIAPIAKGKFTEDLKKVCDYKLQTTSISIKIDFSRQWAPLHVPLNNHVFEIRSSTPPIDIRNARRFLSKKRIGFLRFMGTRRSPH